MRMAKIATYDRFEATWALSVDMPAYQVQKREQENPDDIDEVPVQPADLDPDRVNARHRSPHRQPHHDGHQAEADDHVQRVQARHEEVEREEDLGLAAVWALELESG